MHFPFRRGFRTALLVLLTGCSLPMLANDKKTDKPKAEAAKPKKTIYDYSLVDLDGKVTPLSNYKGKLVLFVNLASQSTYHDQIAALNELQKDYADQGLVVIGIPSTDFGGEELKDPAALKKYYSETAHVAFPVFAAAALRGANEIPLYHFLTDPKDGLAGGDVHWNFTKFLVDKEGLPLARFEVDVDPADVDFHVTVEKALAGKLKKKSGGKVEKPGGDDDEDDDDGE